MMDDLISRQRVLDTIDSYMAHHMGFLDLKLYVTELPSVHPEPKTGRWEYVQYDGNPKIGNWHCSECNRIVCGIIRAGNPVYAYKYCPNCGAKMEEGE